jgi:hypothetical protein
MKIAKDISRDDARRLVGQKIIFGQDWIGKLNQSDMNLLKGDFGPKKTRAPFRGTVVDLVKPCPPGLVSRLERAWGRWQRMVAQLRTVDHWLENHGFNCAAQSFDGEALERAIEIHSSSGVVRIAAPGPGRRATVGPRVEQDMRAALDNGLEPQGFAHMTLKELAVRYRCGQTVARAAREKVLANPRKLASDRNPRKDAGK